MVVIVNAALLIFALIANLVLGWFVYIRSKTNLINQLFCLLSSNIALWTFCVLMGVLSRQQWSALFWIRMCFVVVAFVPAIFYAFVSVFPEGKLLQRQGFLRFLFVSAMFAGLSFSPALLKKVTFESWVPTTYYGPGLPFFTTYVLMSMGYVFFLLFRKWKRTKGRKKAQIQYVFLGVFFLCLFASLTNLFSPLVGVGQVESYGPVFSIILISFIAYAIVRYRLMDIIVVFRNVLIYLNLSGSMVVILFSLLSVFQRFFWNTFGLPSILAIALTALIVALWLQPLRERVETFVDKIFFKGRYDYQKDLAKFSRDITGVRDLTNLQKYIVEKVASIMQVDRCSLMLLDHETGVYKLVASMPEAATPKRVKIGPESILIQKLKEKREVLIREEQRRLLPDEDGERVEHEFEEVNSELSIPLVSDNKLSAIVNLGEKYSGDIYSQEDVNLLSILGNQAAVAIENAKLEAEKRRADRLASVGTLAAGMAHEIKNPLVSIKTFAQLLPEKFADQEFRDTFSGVVTQEVDRINNILEQLLNLTRPIRPNFQPVDVHRVIDQTLSLLASEISINRINMIKGYMKEEVKVIADSEQLKQVFLNLFINSIESMSEGTGGSLLVATSLMTKRIQKMKSPLGSDCGGPKGRKEEYLLIKITDTGQGIPHESLAHLFDPFFSTKDKGTGLGLAIAYNIVREHNGKMEVESRVGLGTTFSIQIPLVGRRPKSKDKRNELSVSSV